MQPTDGGLATRQTDGPRRQPTDLLPRMTAADGQTASGRTVTSGRSVARARYVPASGRTVTSRRSVARARYVPPWRRDQRRTEGIAEMAMVPGGVQIARHDLESRGKTVRNVRVGGLERRRQFRVRDFRRPTYRRCVSQEEKERAERGADRRRKGVVVTREKKILP